jgi:hypothetical protein
MLRSPMGFGPFNAPPHRQNTASFRRFARRRASADGIATTLGKHSFRAIGIMAYLKNGDTLEKAAATANHASPLCDRRRDEVNLDQVERIVI